LVAERAAREGRSIYLLGGAPGVAQAAEVKLCRSSPQLTVAGRSSPVVMMPPSADDLEQIRAELARCRPDIVLVALGSPKQEHVIRALRPDFPAAWMIGVGISLSFVAGRKRRAPRWMRRAGLEWLHRLAHEPRRLGRRYLLDDVPFAFELFARALWRRVSSSR
jgi:N-acetylglucosaminyldiphosphoundecaprenol N-acetyl-beta-D-mannosaminyltransferase